jgi:hypothetical protein
MIFLGAFETSDVFKAMSVQLFCSDASVRMGNDKSYNCFTRFT